MPCRRTRLALHRSPRLLLLSMEDYRGDTPSCPKCGHPALTVPKFCNGGDACKHAFSNSKDATVGDSFGEHLVRSCPGCNVILYEKTKNWTAPAPRPKPEPPKPTRLQRLFARLLGVPAKDLAAPKKDDAA